MARIKAPTRFPLKFELTEYAEAVAALEAAATSALANQLDRNHFTSDEAYMLYASVQRGLGHALEPFEASRKARQDTP